MKFILMSLTLFLLADPVLARPDNNTSECLNIYRTYMNVYGASRFIPEEQMLNFIYRCLPVDPVDSNEAQHQKLLQITDDNEKIITIKS